MNVHKNARTTMRSRAELVRRVLQEGQGADGHVATAVGVDVKTVRKWVARYQAEGVAGLVDRSSRPHRLNKPTPLPRSSRIASSSCGVSAGPASRSRKETRVSPATVSRVLARAGLSRMRGPPEPRRAADPLPVRDRRRTGSTSTSRSSAASTRRGSPRHRRSPDAQPSRGLGVRPCSASTMPRGIIAFSFGDLPEREEEESAVAFLAAAAPLAYYAGLGVTVLRVMQTDNGASLPLQGLPQSLQERRPGSTSSPSLTRHGPTAARPSASSRPPCANGPTPEPTQAQIAGRRASALQLHRGDYNWHRPHGGIKSQTPISRLGLTEDNLLRLHT